jgi:hypothetical protein
VPDTVNPQLQSAIAAPYGCLAWNANPKSAAEWKELVAKLADAGAPARAALREKLAVTMQPAVIGGGKAFILQPKEIPPETETDCSFTCTVAATCTIRGRPARRRVR